MTNAGPTDDWAVALGTLFLLKQEINARENPSLIGYTTAKVRASPADLAEARTRLGALPDSLLGWFAHANGWPEIYFDLSMLALTDVQPADIVATRDDALAAFLSSMDLAPGSDLLVIGTAENTSNRVVTNRTDGTTIWLDEDDAQRFDSMYEFIQAVIDMHRVYLGKHAGR